MPYHVGKAEFERLVEEALTEIPDEFAKFLEEVPIEIHDFPTSRELRERQLAPGMLLLGLYVGRPLTQRSVEDSGAFPDAIYIFQGNIEQVCQGKDDLIRQVRTTVLHEIGHHFGMDEEDLEKLGYG